MAKRGVEQAAEDGAQVYLKRQKIKHVAVSGPVEDIQSSRQLQHLLAFDQDAGRAKHGILSFKAFLDSLSEDDKSDRLAILNEYLHAQIPRDDEDKAAVYLADIMQTWSFASQSNNDSLLSAVPAVLALLFKVLSGKLDFTEYGLRLGRTLLQKRQLELFARGTSTNKSKDFVISPALRLLREITIFNGGDLAKQVFRARDSTLKALARNLGLRYTGEGFEDPRKPSVRTNAFRYFLAIVKFIPPEAQKELLSQRDIISGVTRDMNHDPAFLIAEFLDITKNHILKEEKVPREAKSKLLNSTNLGRIVTLYGYEHQEGDLGEGKKPIESLVHDYLMMACTSSDMGVLIRQAGFYPRGVNPDDAGGQNASQKFIDLGLDSLEWADRFTEKVPVRNTTLSDFIQTLRPWSNIKQSELLLAIFKAAPELVADYFFGKKAFTFEPKLTATWIGYSAFLFSTIQLPVPSFFGNQDRYGRVPPPTPIVIESILPQPLNQKALARCLNQKSSLITFFAIRILIIAFSKLRDVLLQYREASKEGSSIWIQAATKLTDEFCQRCPAMKDVINASRSIPDTDILQRQAASKLLVMYHEVVPQVALESKFDVSNALTNALQALETGSTDSKDSVLRVMEIENLLSIAHSSPGMRWFNKAESLPVSPFTAMLQLSSAASSDLPLLKIRSILKSVAEENGIIHSTAEGSSVDALISALKVSTQNGSSDAYDFIDNCALRCSMTPIKYIDALELEYVKIKASDDKGFNIQGLSVSLLLLAAVEQWPFIVKSDEFEKIENIANFLANYLAASLKINEDENIIMALIKRLIEEASDNPSAQEIISMTSDLVENIKLPQSVGPSIPHKASKVAQKSLDQVKVDVKASMMEQEEPVSEDHTALNRWSTKEIDSVIEEGHAKSLLLLLSSRTLSARKEALTNLAKLSHKLKESTYPEKDQIWILLSELAETARPHIATAPLPNTITAFAAQALSVLQDPLHCLYEKLNGFLQMGPTWALDKIPLMQRILSTAPNIDDAYYLELDWLVTYLLAALRTEADLKIFYQRRAFETLQTLYDNPYLARGLREKITRVFYRATTIDGGSDTLITRFGIISWLQEPIRSKGEAREGVAMRLLLERILETCDNDRLKGWTARTAEEILAESVAV